MVSDVLKLVGFDLQRQLAQLKAQAEEFKNRTTDEIKRSAINAGLAIGLAFAGLMFVVLTLLTCLLALYRWVAIEYGQFLGLGAVALTTAVLAILLFAIAASRAKSAKPTMPPIPRVMSVPPSYSAATQPSQAAAPPASLGFTAGRVGARPMASSLVDTLTQNLNDRAAAVTNDLTDKATAVANEAVDSAIDVIRKSPREAILAALAVAVVTGVVIGRRK